MNWGGVRTCIQQLCFLVVCAGIPFNSITGVSYSVSLCDTRYSWSLHCVMPRLVWPGDGVAGCPVGIIGAVVCPGLPGNVIGGCTRVGRWP